MDEAENVKKAPEFKRIANGLTSFEANGTTYFIQTEITYDRWIKYRKLQVELGYATTFQEIFEEVQNAYDHLNDLRLADSAVIINRTMMGMENVSDEENIPTVFKLCAMFINAAGEDVTHISEDVISRKVGDWRKEPIPVSDFFALALHSIPGFMEIYKTTFPDTSKKTKSGAKGKQE